MADVKNDQTDEKPESCGITTDQHSQQIYIGSVMAGAGYGCPETYTGFLAAALAIKTLGNHVDPTPEQQRDIEAAAAHIVEQVREVEAKLRAERTSGAQGLFVDRGRDPYATKH